MLKTGVKLTDKRLSDEQLNYVVANIVNLFDREILRIVDNSKKTYMIEKFLNLYYNSDVFDFFVPGKLHAFTSDVFENRNLRDFIFNLTDKVSILLSTKDIEEAELYNTLVKAVCRNKVHPEKDNELALTPTEISQTLYVDEEQLFDFLRSNFWITVTYLLIVFFYESQVIASITKTQLEEK